MYNTKLAAVVFDGKKAHEVTPLTGERFSVVLFSTAADQAAASLLREAEDRLGITLPSQVQLQELATWQNKILTEQQRQEIAANRARATARRAERKADRPGPKAKAASAVPEKTDKAAPKRYCPESGSERKTKRNVESQG